MSRIFVLLALSLASVHSWPEELPSDYPQNEDCYSTETDGTQGWCEHDNCCEGSYYISNLCLDYPSQVGISLLRRKVAC